MNNGRIFIDFETQSEADLQQVGAWVYSQHPSTDIIVMCWKIRYKEFMGETDTLVGTWHPGDPFPEEVDLAIRAHYELEAHNYSFELGIWENIGRPRYGFPLVFPKQWRDTMAVAHYYALPGKLESLCRALGMPGKDPRGGRLISKYCKLHLKTAVREIPPEVLLEFDEYCMGDVLAEERVSDFLGDLPERELPAFYLDQTVNLRGLLLDAEGIEAATAIVDQRSEELTEAFRAITGLNPSQGIKLKQWFIDNGLAVDNLQASYLEDLADSGNIPAGLLREAVRIRLAINKASTKKLDAMSRHRGPDGRARWQARYHGAQTGRDTGSGFQPLNLNRGFEDVEPDQLVRDIHTRSPAFLDALYGDAMEAVGKASRHWITPAPGHRILAGDFVSIEAVVLACLAGEEWKVEAFRSGAKIYEMMADEIYNLPPGTVTKKTHPTERQDGKTGELAFGYQGSLGAWLKFDSSGRHSDERILEINRIWRGKHPAIVAFWAGLEQAALQAMDGSAAGYRDIGFEVQDEWLSMILPNGKRIWYFDPEIKWKMPRWHSPETKEDCRSGACRCQSKPTLTYMAQKEGQWRRVDTYGGKLAENATQATAREYMNPSALAAEKAGYPVILKVYDEVVTEPAIGFGSVEEFCDILRNAPGREWAAGWPIGVDAWEGGRYKK